MLLAPSSRERAMIRQQRRPLFCHALETALVSRAGDVEGDVALFNGALDRSAALLHADSALRLQDSHDQ